MNLCSYGSWQLYDFLDSIAEIRRDYELCYPRRKSKVIPIETIITEDEKIGKIYLEKANYTEILNNIENFSKAYLKPQMVKCDKDKYVCMTLRRKLNGVDISKNSYSGQYYLQMSHEKNGRKITLPREINMYIALFILGSLCRYYPGRWNPFSVQDSTGEKLLVEKLMFYSRRILPNIALNKIVGKDICFVADRYSPENKIKAVGEHEVRDMVKKAVRSELNGDVSKGIFGRR